MKNHRVENHYDFDGIGINVSGDPVISAAVHSRLRRFATDFPRPPDLKFEFCHVESEKHHVVERPEGNARPVYELPSGEAIYLADADQFYMNYDDSVRVLCDLKDGHARVSIARSETDNVWLASHPLLTIPLLELLKRRGRYNVHAAGLAIDGRGFLLAGASGAGKSTLTVALLRAGFDFLGDDMLFLKPGRAGLRVLAFPDEIDITDQTARFFPELQFVLNRPKLSGAPKRQVHVEEVYEVDTAMECEPKVIIFPLIAGVERSTLHLIDQGDALLELVPNVLLTDARYCQAHLDALSELVKRAKCYRLKTGRDFDRVPELLRDIAQ